MQPAAAKNSGFSIVELLIAIGLALVIFFAAGNLFQQQMVTVRKLKMKLELTSLYLDVQRSFSISSNCIGNLGAPFSIDETRVTEPNYAIRIQSLREIGPPSITLLQPGQRISNMTHESVVGTIRASNIQRVGPDSFLLDIMAPINDSEGKFIFMMNLSRVRVNTDPSSPTQAKRPISCNYGMSVAGDNCRLVEETGSENFQHIIMCAADEVVLTGGGNCMPRTGIEWNEPSAPVDPGYVLLSRPVTSGSLTGWEFDCFLPSLRGDFAVSQTSAYCCKR